MKIADRIMILSRLQQSTRSAIHSVDPHSIQEWRYDANLGGFHEVIYNLIIPIKERRICKSLSCKCANDIYLDNIKDLI